MNVPPWVVPGTFCICDNDDWAPRSNVPADVVKRPPRKGKIYTIAGVIDLGDRAPRGGLVVALAEYPHNAFSLDFFKPVPPHDAARFRLLLNPLVPVTQPDTVIEMPTLGRKWVV